MGREDVRERPEPIFRTYQRLAAAMVGSAFLSTDVAELLAGALCASYAVFDRRVEALEAAERSTRKVCDELRSMVASHRQAVVRAQLYRNDPYDAFDGFLPPLTLSDAVGFRHEECCGAEGCAHHSVAWVGVVDEYDCWTCAQCASWTE